MQSKKVKPVKGPKKTKTAGKMKPVKGPKKMKKY